MQLLLIVTLYNLLSVILAGSDFDIINANAGDLHIEAAVGQLPIQYMPLSKQDIKASEKAADVVDFVPLVPMIDPMIIPALPPQSFDVSYLWLKSKVYLQNFVLAGIKQLQLNGIELRLVNLRSDINVTIPKLHFEGDFNMQGAVSFLPVSFKCHVSATLNEVAVTASSGGHKTPAPKIGEVLQIDSAAVKVDIKNVVFNLTNMVMGDEVGAISVFSTGLFNFHNDKSGNNLLNSFLKTAIDMANKELYQIAINDFIKDYLLSDSY